MLAGKIYATTLNRLNVIQVMSKSFTTVVQAGNQIRDFFIDSVKIKSEGEFPISTGTFFQS